jgi:hypothetical protein
MRLVTVSYSAVDSVKIVGGCFPAIEHAVKAVQRAWDPYCKTGGEFRLANLFNDLVEPAWRSYVETIPPSTFAGKVSRNMRMHAPHGSAGFRTLEGALRTQARLVLNDSGFAADGKVVYCATIDTLINLILACDAKPPKKRNILDGIRRRRTGDEFCKFCGEHTELHAATSPDAGAWIPLAGLSDEFCARHKKGYEVSGDSQKKQNADYFNAKRTYGRFLTVLSNLNRQSRLYKGTSGSSARGSTDRFYALVIGSLEARIKTNPPPTLHFRCDCGDPNCSEWDYVDMGLLRNCARQIVDAGIKDRWMQIIAFKHDGITDAELARGLGLTMHELKSTLMAKRFRQIPKEFRFDVARTGE